MKTSEFSLKMYKKIIQPAQLQLSLRYQVFPISHWLCFHQLKILKKYKDEYNKIIIKEI
jgi:hypothetical protein